MPIDAARQEAERLETISTFVVILSDKDVLLATGSGGRKMVGVWSSREKARAFLKGKQLPRSRFRLKEFNRGQLRAFGLKCGVPYFILDALPDSNYIARFGFSFRDWSTQ